MKPTVILTAAIAAAATVILPQTLDARDNHGGGGGGGRSYSAPQASAPHVSASSAPRVSAQQFRSAPAQNFRSSGPTQFSRPSVNVERGNSNAWATQSRPVQTQRQQQAQIRQPQTQQFSRSRQAEPSIAFGGSVPQQRVNRDNQQRVQQENAQNRAQANRNWNNNSQINNITRAQALRMRPSDDISRHWDHGKVYSWNHHRYHYRNNNWVILDSGYYGYGGGYYDTPYDAGYYYDDGTADYAPPTNDDNPVYDTPANLASEVQEQLTRQGYDTGGVDGVIGAQTRNAIAAFQNDRRMPVTGRIDQSLLRALRIQ